MWARFLILFCWSLSNCPEMVSQYCLVVALLGPSFRVILSEHGFSSVVFFLENDPEFFSCSIHLPGSSSVSSTWVACIYSRISSLNQVGWFSIRMKTPHSFTHSSFALLKFRKFLRHIDGCIRQYRHSHRFDVIILCLRTYLLRLLMGGRAVKGPGRVTYVRSRLNNKTNFLTDKCW